MALLSRREFAARAGVSHQSISKAIKTGKLTLGADGLLDTNDPANRRYLRAEHVYSRAAKTGAAAKKKADPVKHGHGKRKEKCDDGKYGQKLDAEIRLKHEQADFHAIRKAERLGLLIETSIVEQKLSVLGAELRIRLLELPARVGPRLWAIAKQSDSPHALIEALEDEISDAVKKVKDAAIRSAR